MDLLSLKDSNAIWKLVFLEVGMLSPIVIMCISLVYFDMFTLSALLYNGISLALVPLIYIKYLSPSTSEVRKSISYYLKDKLNDMKKQLIIGLCLLTAIYLGVVINYDICEHYFRKEIIDKIVIDFDKNPWNFCLLVVIFGLVNPCLEEFFWRNFIPQAVFDLLQHPYVSSYSQEKLQKAEDEENQEQQNNNISRNQSAVSEDPNSQLIMSNPNSKKLHQELYQILFTLHYASYHFFVVFHISNALFAALATITVAIAGRFFLFLNYRLGYATNALAHMGADLGFCTIALVLFYHNKILF